MNPDATRYSWDISWDNKTFLSTGRSKANYKASNISLERLPSGESNSFDHFSDGIRVQGTLSPNGKLIALDTVFKTEHGIVIKDIQGKQIKQITHIAGKEVKNQPVWMPDNTLLITVEGAFMKSNEDFSAFAVVKNLAQKSVGRLAVSNDNQQIAFSANNHIWLLSVQRKNIKQITTSNTGEGNPVFSPDNKYRIIGVDQSMHANSSGTSYLYTVPTDGKQYKVNHKDCTQGVIPIQLKGQSLPEATSRRLVWR